MGSGTGNFGFSIPYDWHRNRRRRDRWRSRAPWVGSPGDGTHSSAARFEPRSVSWVLPVSRRLSGGISIRSGNRATLGSGGHQSAACPSGMGTGGALSGARFGQLGMHHIAAPHFAWRRSDAAGVAVSHDPCRAGEVAQWLCARARVDGRLGPVCDSARVG